MKERLIKLLEGRSIDTPSDVEYVADLLIANGWTLQEWIPVEKRLPTEDDADESESILAVTKKGVVNRWWWRVVAEAPSEFTHWMTMPKAPRNGDNN